jgi:crossover junction endodeoxyribonuclease RuvC
MMMYKKSSPIPNITILGIDPGTMRIGYGVINKRGSHLEALAYGVIEPKGMNGRFRDIEAGLNRLIKKYKPDVAAVEKIFFSKNKKTAMAVAEARGVILFILERHKIKTLEFSPNDIRAAVTGSGMSGKKIVSQFTAFTLGLKKISGYDDASDALAVAVRAAFERDLPAGRG